MGIANLKVLVLPSFYPMEHNYVRGGFFEEQTVLIKKKGADVSVIFNEDRSITSFSLAKLRDIHFQKQYKIENGVPVYRKLAWNLIPTRFNIGQKLWAYNSIRLVKSYMHKYGKPDLFHVHCAFNAGRVAEYFKLNYNIPYIITEHSTLFALSDISIAQKELVLSIYNNAEKVIVVSNPFRELLASKLGFDKKRIDVIPNFIDSNYFNPNSKDLENLQSENIIFTVCHHEHKKRLDRLLDSFILVSAIYPNWKLYIGGEGSQTNDLKLKAKDLGLLDKVVFTGFLSKEGVRNYMKKSKIFVLPSDVETFGVVIIEAMAMGLPVVATISGGPEDIITRATGLLVEKDVSSLANGVMEVISQYSNYVPRDIRSYVVENFSGDSVAEKYIKIYANSLI